MTVAPPERVVVVGAGHAGLTLVTELRSEGYAGSIDLLDEQDRPPYQRPPLSKAYLKGDLPADGLPFRPAGYFDQEAIRYRRASPVRSIDRGGRVVLTASGEEIAYDALVIATGARARTAPFPTQGIDGVHELRSWEDADAVSAAIGASRRLVVVGGGFIGLEVASAARSRGLEVTVLEAQPRLMSRAVGEVVAEHCLVSHRAMGTRVQLATAVAGLVEQDGRVVAVALASGERIPTDAVVLGTGVAPRTELAAAADLAIDNGVAVNEYLETSDPAISALGDCCSFPDARSGRRVRLESVQNATDQARAVARRLLGHRAPYVEVPWFWSDQAGLKLQMAGLAEPGDREVVHGDPEAGRFTVLRFSGSTLVAGESVNATGDHVSLRTVVAHPTDADVVAAFAGEGPPVDLRSLARTLRAKSQHQAEVVR